MLLRYLEVRSLVEDGCLARGILREMLRTLLGMFVLCVPTRVGPTKAKKKRPLLGLG